MNPSVTEYINNHPADQCELMAVIRALIHESVPNVVEEFKWSRPIFRTHKDFAYLQANKEHINLGFYSGFEKLEDPKKLLEGTGKTMRHVKLRTMMDVDRDQLEVWFKMLAGE